MEDLATELVAIGRKDGKDNQVIFNQFLDYTIDCFSIHRLIEAQGDYHMIFKELKEEKNVFFPVFSAFLMSTVEYLSINEVYDFFGDIYENMFQSGNKAQNLGQFFTPQKISNLCAGIIHTESDGSTSNEPTCGSGRNLLALFAKNGDRYHYYVGEDVDGVSVKMCTVNMMINGIRGCCICHDTLIRDDFIFGYEINEVRYPFPCGCYSIREINKEEYLKRLK
ncbi:protein containing N-6 DNA methylase domain protein [gut metagenome]|uniref:site-specific DNA-methyltransferase (adenine-specific) n=1 Tax=gut metagenome TaxID=749906 RepID=J9D9F7_9ZZZZ